MAKIGNGRAQKHMWLWGGGHAQSLGNTTYRKVELNVMNVCVCMVWECIGTKPMLWPTADGFPQGGEVLLTHTFFCALGGWGGGVFINVCEGA